MKPTYILPSSIVEAVPVVNKAIAEYNKAGRRIVIYDYKTETCPAFYHEVEMYHIEVPTRLTRLTAPMLEYALLSAGTWKRLPGFDDVSPSIIQSFHHHTLAAILDIVKIAPEAFPDVLRR